MAVDYDAVASDQARLERTAANSLRTLSTLYAERAHFVFELLQNAEDALRRRGPGWRGPRTVTFHLTSDCLRVSHYGEPFNEADVLSICGVGETTKELTDIGTFGIGFKSVYAFTERPTIHSGREDFAIEDFIRPVAERTIERHGDETVFLIPLKASDPSGHDDIARGLEGLGAASLLFLRQIEAIHWSVEDGPSGIYLRGSEAVEPSVRRVTVMGQEGGRTETDERWLVFSRGLSGGDGEPAGNVELAFSLAGGTDSGPEHIKPVERSPLVVFFPTAVETRLGFLVQGPYRTTPSRENVPQNDTWNEGLVVETASLLCEVLPWLRDNGLLDTAGLHCLPLDWRNFREGSSMFMPLYRTTKTALSTESLLPRFDGGHVAANGARLGASQALRELFTAKQLGRLYGAKDELAWLSEEISHGRTSVLRGYVMRELGVPELTTEKVIGQLDRAFLEAQSDDWVKKLYESLSRQPGLREKLQEVPLVRLANGSHVRAHSNGQPEAFLPGDVATDFPIVHAAVCTSETSLEFLRSLGLTEPDPVDDVVRNLLPHLGDADSDPTHASYGADIDRILNAFRTDSKGQREKLLSKLRETRFVMAVNAGDGSKRISRPADVYLATGRLKQLFAGVGGVLLVDDSYEALRGDDVRDLLEACGASRDLRTVPVDCRLTSEEKKDIRRKAGLERSSSDEAPRDVTLHGLDGLLSRLPMLEPAERPQRAALLWEALAHLENRRGSGVFTGEYTWTFARQEKTAAFDASFVRQLNDSEWVPDQQGGLQAPKNVVFETLEWEPNPVLQSRIHFRPPVIDQLAREAGIEPGVLDLLRSLGVTSESELRERLGVVEEPPEDVAPATRVPGQTVDSASSEAREPKDRAVGPTRGDARQSNVVDAGHAPRASKASVPSHVRAAPASDDKGAPSGAPNLGGGSRTPNSEGERLFISYVGAHTDKEAADPDGLGHSARMALEAKAIDFILSSEKEWQRTPPNNPGFDLFIAAGDGPPTSLCEVKAMTGSLNDHPVTISRTQFDYAREHGEAYWLYVVERAGSDSARIVRIRDPAGKARAFTFDRGWRDVAEGE